MQPDHVLTVLPCCTALCFPASHRRQPKSVTWFMDGKPLKTMTNGEPTSYNGGTKKTVYQSPSLPMRPSFTMWTDTRATDPFGGRIDASKGPYVAAFSSMRQVVCDPAVPAAATVPAWLA